MSTWTHVAGLIRLDTFFEKNITIDFNKDIATGSEGSLNWKFELDKRPSSICLGTVSIWGGCQDDEDDEE